MTNAWTRIDPDDPDTWPPDEDVWLIVPAYARAAMIGYYKGPLNWSTYLGMGVQEVNGQTTHFENGDTGFYRPSHWHPVVKLPDPFPQPPACADTADRPQDE